MILQGKYSSSLNEKIRNKSVFEKQYPCIVDITVGAGFKPSPAYRHHTVVIIEIFKKLICYKNTKISIDHYHDSATFHPHSIYHKSLKI